MVKSLNKVVKSYNNENATTFIVAQSLYVKTYKKLTYLYAGNSTKIYT